MRLSEHEKHEIEHSCYDCGNGVRWEAVRFCQAEEGIEDRERVQSRDNKALQEYVFLLESAKMLWMNDYKKMLLYK